MARPCSICEHPNRKMIEAKVRSGSPYTDVERWLATTPQPASRMAISRHAGHAGLAIAPRSPGPRPASTDFLGDVVAYAHDDMRDGVTRPTIGQAIAAQGLIDRRTEGQHDRELMVKIAWVLSGVPLPDPSPILLDDGETIDA